MTALYKRVRQVIRYLAALRLPVYASHASFFIILAAFPTLVLLLGLLRYTGVDVKNFTGLLEGVLPQALLPAAEDLVVTAYYGTTGGVLSFSALTALWSAGRGIHALMSGLNAIYGTQENRGYFRTRALSTVYTVAFLLVLLLTILLQLFGNDLARLPAQQDGALFHFLTEATQLRHFVLLGVQTALFTAMYAVLPNRKNSFASSLPGALLGCIGWLVFSDLYSIYVEHFTGYTNIFGSVYAVALSMLWLYCCVSILFYGGVLNAWLAQDANRKM